MVLAWILVVIGAIAVAVGAVRGELVWQFVASGASVAALGAGAVAAARAHHSYRRARLETRSTPRSAGAEPPAPDEESG